MDHLVGLLFVGFWVALCAAVVVRLVLALRRRRRGSSLQDSVLRPVVSTGTLSVWPVRDPRQRHPELRPEDLPEQESEPRSGQARE